jgi:hypothetical protein
MAGIGLCIPTDYETLSEEDKKNIAQLRTDFCIITYADHTDKFIRCTLTKK